MHLQLRRIGQIESRVITHNKRHQMSTLANYIIPTTLPLKHCYFSIEYLEFSIFSRFRLLETHPN